MVPTVAEIVLIVHPVLRLSKDLGESNPSLVLALHAEFGIGFAVICVSALELVQMAVSPAHDDLQDLVQLEQRDVR